MVYFTFLLQCIYLFTLVIYMHICLFSCSHSVYNRFSECWTSCWPLSWLIVPVSWHWNSCPPCCHYTYHLKQHPVVQSHIRTIPITVTALGSSHQEVSMMGPAGQSQCDLLPMHNRTQFISEDLPPSYDVATAYASYTTPSVAQV